MTGRIKNFYVILEVAKDILYYTKIEATLMMDARLGAEHFWPGQTKAVYTSGQFWIYKKNHPKITELPQELA